MRARGFSTAAVAALGLLAAGMQAPSLALAVAPEVPVTEAATAVTSTSATLHGELNPNTEATTGYEFTYNTNGTCEGVTSEPGAEAKGEALIVSTSVTGLEPNRTYTFCVVAIQTSEEEGTQTAAGSPLTFATPASSPSVEGESVSGVAPFEATLEAQINANNQGTLYSFQYSSTPPAGEKLEGAIDTVEGANLLQGFGVQAASVPTGAVLTPETTYYYRVLATNATGTTEGKVEEFTTPSLQAPLIDGESAFNITQTDAQLQAFINPNYQATSFQFALGLDTSYSLGSVPATPGELGAGFGDNEVTVDLHNEGVELQPNTEYHYQALATNASGSIEGLSAQGDTTFLTLPNPPTVSTGEASSITPSSATIAGTVNPGSSGHPSQDDTTYLFQYGTDTLYGSQSPLEPGDAGEGESAVPETANLTGLEHGATFHYRIAATNNASGAPQTVYGEDKTFTTTSTPPILSGISVTELSSNSAAIAAMLDPQGLQTRYELQIGATPGQLQQAAAGEATEPVPLTLELAALSPGTIYYYTLIASNENGTSTSEGSFTTPAGPPPTSPLGTPSSPPLLAIPAIRFPATGKGHPPTRAEKLASALKACQKKPRSRRAACKRQAKRKYGKTKSKSTSKKR
jgi:hypothetical protein